MDERGVDAYEEDISKSNIKTSEIVKLMEESGNYNVEILKFSPEIHKQDPGSHLNSSRAIFV